jgi:hypothetical protein
VLTLLAEVTQAWEAITTAKAACAMAVLVAETSAQEATVTWDSTAALVKGAEDRAALTRNEVQERVSRVDEDSIMALASACNEIESIVRKVTLLEGELAEVRWACEVAEETAHGLSDTTTDAKRRQEEFERGHRELLDELILL